MATQSLYRRYRPRRFSELKGQDHVVRALRDAVRSGREGQAYLFSGPRGTGKTSSARILAKVLNCAEPVDGEPCCECESCLAVERGTSYDVHELDAASNNGVDAIRDLIEKASLGTPGRHRVYILDEVHMLSRPAEAALLKTLEEPPPHVVFVLATTDPQKMSDTIRSRTQHLQFHLLPPDTLAEHVRWVAADAGLDLDEDAIDSVIDAGGGSARDTLSALELLVATGGDTSDRVDPDVFVRALIDRDPAAVLTAVAHAVRSGHEPRTLTEALVRHLRDSFLALMAPDLVLLPRARVEQIAEQARELGAAAVVRTIERLGASLVEMRHAPDPRVLLEVALIRLTHDDAAGPDVGALTARVERLEHALHAGTSAGGSAAGQGSPLRSAPTPTPVDPGTGRAVVGGRARKAVATATSPGSPPADPNAAAPSETAASSAAPSATPSVTPSDTPPAAVDAAPTAAAPDVGAPAPPSGTSPVSAAAVVAAWEETVRPGLKPIVRALYSGVTFGRNDGDVWFVDAPNEVHAAKCDAHREAVERALTDALGVPVQIAIAVGGVTADHDPGGPSARSGGTADGDRPTAASGRAAPVAPPPAPPDDESADIDLDDLVDAPPESVLTPIDRLAQAFPGAELIDDDR